jgi:arsenate reductase-like glutaredoxin family protein
MKKIFYLGNCGTCQRILEELQPGPAFEMREIKSLGIQPDEIEEMKTRAGSYEALFSRRAMKYRSMGLNNMTLGEDDYRRYILEEYTFLKRPVIILDDQIFVGSTKKVVEAAKNALQAEAV